MYFLIMALIFQNKSRAGEAGVRCQSVCVPGERQEDGGKVSGEGQDSAEEVTKEG